MERERQRDYSVVNVTAIKELVDHGGWKEFVTEVNLWIEDIRDMLVTSNDDDEKHRGRIDGLQTMLEWPEQVIEMAIVDQQDKEDKLSPDKSHGL